MQLERSWLYYCTLGGSVGAHNSDISNQHSVYQGFRQRHTYTHRTSVINRMKIPPHSSILNFFLFTISRNAVISDITLCSLLSQQWSWGLAERCGKFVCEKGCESMLPRDISCWQSPFFTFYFSHVPICHSTLPSLGSTVSLLVKRVSKFSSRRYVRQSWSRGRSHFCAHPVDFKITLHCLIGPDRERHASKRINLFEHHANNVLCSLCHLCSSLQDHVCCHKFTAGCHMRAVAMIDRMLPEILLPEWAVASVFWKCTLFCHVHTMCLFCETWLHESYNALCKCATIKHILPCTSGQKGNKANAST